MTPLARWAHAEWGLLYATVRGPLAKHRLRAVPMTTGAVCLTALLQFAQNQSWGYGFVQDVGAVRVADPLWASLSRTPLSLFVPALDLPVWGALAQVLVVFGLAEVCLGWWRTLVVAYAATLAGTLYARTGVALGPHGPLGLPASDARVVDTGPSAAVVGLAVYLGWRYGAYVTAGAVAAAMAVEVAVKDNLAGKEHLAAIAGTAALCAAVPAGRRLRHRWRHRRPGSGPGPGPWPGRRSGSGRSGLPPIQS
ncbi:hypothetical protein ACWDE0_05760 [Streptomyces sp. 900105755]|uniref:hypothetical protein n=1 Tax=Streptomyces sp. Ag109_O5-10 TaxID=1855349 RepID=UPI000894FC0D|nr:hypothetical protein [Streptomyces sp. Ag109_O5-10]SEF09707.1 hypothetical protein SAMN05216533_6248 [Streptomyces sp. Ag109_O5-10]